MQKKRQKLFEQRQFMNSWHCLKDLDSLHIHLGCNSLCDNPSETYKAFNSHLQSIILSF